MIDGGIVSSSGGATQATTFRDIAANISSPPDDTRSGLLSLVLFALVLCVPVLYWQLKRRFAKRAGGSILCAQIGAGAALLILGYATMVMAAHAGEFADSFGELCGIYAVTYAGIAISKNLRSLAAQAKAPLAAAPANGSENSAWPFLLAAMILMLRSVALSADFMFSEWSNPRAELLFSGAVLAGGLVLAWLAVRSLPAVPLACVFLLVTGGLNAPALVIALTIAALPGPWLALRYRAEFAPVRKQARWGWAVVPLAPFAAMFISLLMITNIIGWPTFIVAAGALATFACGVPGAARASPASAPIASALASLAVLAAPAWHRLKTGLCYGIPVCIAVYMLLMAPFSLTPSGTDPAEYERDEAALRPLVALGSAKAELYTGFLWSAAMNPHRSDTEAMKWYLAAATHGDSFAMVTVAQAYASGEDGAPKDAAEAAKWYREAAGRGETWAQIRLGDMYEKGEGGVEKDKKAALDWYRRAAAQGQPEAYSALYRIYKAGDGVPADDNEAYFWFLLLRRDYEQIGFGGLAGDDAALRNRLTSDALAAARQRVEDWRPRPEHFAADLALWPF